MGKRRISRRRFVSTTAAASTSLLAAPFVRTAGAAGNLSLALWDHWVPGGNTAMTEICQAWADKEKVNLQIDYLSTQGNKLYLTIAAEAWQSPATTLWTSLPGSRHTTRPRLSPSMT